MASFRVISLACVVALVSANKNTSIATSTSTTITTGTHTTAPAELKDCVCKSSWTHNEYKCNKTMSGGHIVGTIMKGCPSLENLEVCETDPQQSWCRTTEESCRQQTEKNMMGDGWVFCDPDTNKPELPGCTCATVWLNGHGKNCQRAKKTKRTQGCPTLEELRQCDPDYEGQSWCLTNEGSCLEQEDCEDCDSDSQKMVGEHWAYCNPETQQAELPDCECEDNWMIEAGDCAKQNTPFSFSKCPTLEEIQKCDPQTTQSWCHTKQERCKQQSKYVGDGDMSQENQIDQGWTYCDPESNKPQLPKCECKQKWYHNELDCKDSPLEMEACPSVGDLRKCEWIPEPAQAWCETTYETCEEQNYESEDDGWVYCDTKSNEPILPNCECMDTWTYQEEGSACANSKTPVRFKGCPTLEELSQCEEERVSWCMTKDFRCLEQNKEDNNIGMQWVYCDPESQLAVRHPHTGGAIGITFVLTVILCALLFVGILYAYRGYVKKRKAGYSRELLGDK